MGYQPTVTGTRYMISAGHYLASQAGFEILEAGGNAIDAGVAAGLVLGVVQPDIVQFGGVAPIMIRPADGEVITISGLGTWPRAATLDRFVTDHGGTIPTGVLRTVVPAAPDAWITALRLHGTMPFGEVAAAAIRCARDGFTVHPLLHGTVEANRDAYGVYPANAAQFLPSGEPPPVGSLFVQSELASSIQHMADREQAAGGSREHGLVAARDAFYRGDLAEIMISFQEAHGGLIDREDLASYTSLIEKPATTAFGDIDVFACGPWTQGPALLQMLALLEGIDVAALGHNSAEYLHVITEVMKLSFGDRETFYGDPNFVDVPLDRLLSAEYNAERRNLIRSDEAWIGQPPTTLGATRDETGRSSSLGVAGDDKSGDIRVEPDTSYVCVVDADGNVFSATPSDATYAVPVIPELGFAMSGRGSQSHATPGHPSAIEAGKRPRLTPNPALAVGPDFVMPFGTPGGDSQCQAMLQVFLNIHVFGMDVQDAVEAPRVITHNPPSSFEPHGAHPGRLDIEDRIDESVRTDLADRGHVVRVAPSLNPGASAVCAILADQTTGTMWGASDPRRPGRAIGW